MKTIDVIQGSPEWLAHRANPNLLNASDGPAMMGQSKYKSRTELLRERATGIIPDVDAATQRKFDDGHAAEALARPLAEAIIGQDLYPVVGVTGEWSASFDGLTIGEDIVMEHKSLNDEIRACKSAAELHPMYRIQMEIQLAVSGAESCLFLATQWDGDTLADKREFWYEPDLAMRAEIAAAWEQFKRDMAAYQPPEVLPPVTAAPVMALPALSIQVNGAITLTDNLKVFGEKLTDFIAKLDLKPSSDQAFADAEAAVKTLETAENALEAAESSALAQTASTDEMRRTVALYAGQARTTRLLLQRVVKERKEQIRLEIVQAGRSAFAEHMRNLNARLGKPYMPPVAENFAGVIKGKKTLASLRDAVDTELARLKIEANACADSIQLNLNTLRELAKDLAFLFADTAQIVLKAPDDLTALVKNRIREHQEAEAKRIEAERAKIQQEEEAKARAKVEAEEQAKREQEALAQKAAATQDTPAVPVMGGSPHPGNRSSDPGLVSAAAPDNGARIKLGDIGSRLGFALPAEFLATLGFQPVGTSKAAKLYREADFVPICAALIRHIQAASETRKAA